MTDIMLYRMRDHRRDMTGVDARLRRVLRGGTVGGHRPRRQQVIGGCLADFYCHSAVLIVEVAGPVHDADTITERVSLRDHAFAECDIRTRHVTNHDGIQNLPPVLTRIRQPREAR